MEPRRRKSGGGGGVWPSRTHGSLWGTAPGTRTRLGPGPSRACVWVALFPLWIQAVFSSVLSSILPQIIVNPNFEVAESDYGNNVMKCKCKYEAHRVWMYNCHLGEWGQKGQPEKGRRGRAASLSRCWHSDLWAVQGAPGWWIRLDNLCNTALNLYGGSQDKANTQ